MKQKLIYGGVVVLVVGAVVVGWAMYQPANNPNFPEGTDWLCTDRACGIHFKLTTSQLSDHYKQHYGQRPKADLSEFRPKPIPEERSGRSGEAASAGRII